MNSIALDIGTTAAKAAAFRQAGRVGDILRCDVPLQLQGPAAELDAETAVTLAFDLLRQAGRLLQGRVDRIAIATMHPAVCLLDAADRPITPLLCHLDRRSEPQALEIADRFGQRQLLQTIGNLPIPGGIAATMLRWLQVHQPDTYRRAARVAPLVALLTNRLTGRHACDPGTATFLGVCSIAPAYQVDRIEPWAAMLEFLELPPAALPQIVDGGTVIGRVRSDLARDLGFDTQPEVLAGLMDTSAACVHAGLAPGHLYNVIGTTDVLVICTDRPHPQEGVLTRPAGTGPLWLAISTMAAVGAALDWAHRTFFADLDDAAYFALVARTVETLQASHQPAEPGALGEMLVFDPDLAGSRMQVRQQYGRIQGLRLSTTREQILEALLASLADRSERRLGVLAQLVQPDGRVFVAGGASQSGIQRSWTSRYRVTTLPPDALLQGLARLADAAN